MKCVSVTTNLFLSGDAKKKCRHIDIKRMQTPQLGLIDKNRANLMFLRVELVARWAFCQVCISFSVSHKRRNSGVSDCSGALVELAQRGKSRTSSSHWVHTNDVINAFSQFKHLFHSELLQYLLSDKTTKPAEPECAHCAFEPSQNFHHLTVLFLLSGVCLSPISDATSHT